jgi:hypothetical protein
VHALVLQAGERLDRDVESLEVVGAVERGDEGRDQRAVRDGEPGPQARVVGPGGEELGVDAVRHLGELLGPALAHAAQVGHRGGVVRRQDADPVGCADEERRDRVFVRREEGPASAAADEPVLVVDEKGLAPALAAEATEQCQLRAEDERVVQMDDVEAAHPGEARDQRRVADRQHGVDPVDDRPARVRRVARRGGREDLDVVAALRLARGEAVGGVAGASRIRREGRREVGDPQCLANRRRRRAARRRPARSSGGGRRAAPPGAPSREAAWRE